MSLIMTNLNNSFCNFYQIFSYTVKANYWKKWRRFHKVDSERKKEQKNRHYSSAFAKPGAPMTNNALKNKAITQRMQSGKQ